MALPTNTITAAHQFVSAVDDGGDTSLVQPSNWNADHPVTGFGVISADCTLTVGAAGCDYTTVSAALAALNNWWIAATATVTISVAAETIAESAIVFKHACGASVKIAGATTVTRTMSSVVSSSGSTGAWSVVVQLDDNSGISAGHFVAIKGLSGGTNPQRMYGLHKVESVGGSNQITVAVRNRNTSAPSGSVAGSVRVIKSVLTFASGTALTLDNGRLGQITELVIDASASTGSPSVKVSNSASLMMSPYAGVNGNSSAWGVLADSGSSLTFTDSYLSGSEYGLYANMGGYIMAHRCIVTGVVNDGVLLARQANMTASDMISTGNATGISASHSSFASVGSIYVISDNTSAQLSPAISTVGNNNAYIGPG